MIEVPRFSLVVPVQFPLRIADTDVIEVTVISGTALSPTRDVLARIVGADALNLAHQPQLSRGAVLLRSTKMPTAPRGNVVGLPPHEPVQGLLIFGPCR